MLYPLKFIPITKQTLWGGRRLADKAQTSNSQDTIGESWEISGVQDNISVVAEGVLAENTLEELIEVYMGDLVGDKVYEKFGQEFPLLIKYIDACKDLSIQVHPDDQTARERHRAYGKTEMWYVVDAKPESNITLGFNTTTDKGEFLSRLYNLTLTEILNIEQTKPGDAFFIPSGTIHAISKGNLIAEIQQTSDITYRIYDYDRTDREGNKRELHTELAADVINYQKQEGLSLHYTDHKNHSEQLVSCDYFTVNRIRFDKEMERDYFGIDSFVVYMCLEGEFTLVYETDQFIKVHKGETVLLPALFKNVFLIPARESTILETYIP